jgi:hypothetical protein
MTNSLITISQFSAITSKNGKVSERSERVARSLAGASSGVQMALALHGSSAAKKTFATGVVVTTLENLLALSSIEGSQWPDVYAHLADRFGYSIEGGRGKAACRALVAFAQCSLNARKLVAEHDGCTESQFKTIGKTQTLIDACVMAFDVWQAYADSLTANSVSQTETV